LHTLDRTGTLILSSGSGEGEEGSDRCRGREGEALEGLSDWDGHQPHRAQQLISLPKKIKVKSIGNIVHESVPVSNNEDNNAVVREWAPQGVTFEKRDVLSRMSKSCLALRLTWLTYWNQTTRSSPG